MCTYMCMYQCMIGLKGAQCKSCPLCAAHFAPNMLDSIHEMKTITPTTRPPLLLEQAPITLIKLLERFMNGERKFTAATLIDNSIHMTSTGGSNTSSSGGGGAMVEFADMLLADSSVPSNNANSGSKDNNDNTKKNDKVLPTSSPVLRPTSGIIARPSSSSAKKATPSTSADGVGTPKTLTPAAARLAKKQAELLAAQIASLVKKQTAKTMTTLFIDLMGENWKNYIQGSMRILVSFYIRHAWMFLLRNFVIYIYSFMFF